MTVSAATTTTPTTSSSSPSSSLAAGQNSLNSTYSSFLTLLTTQLQNQDPLNPTDTNTFTQQLVSMNGVQQQLLTNNLLQQLVTQNTGVNSAVGLIGKSVTAQSSTQALQNGQAAWTYNLASNASSATLQVQDASGNIVWAGNAPSLSAGTNSFTWNGQTLLGPTLTSGNYTLNVSAVDSTGKAITSTVGITGTVTSASVNNGTTQVNVGTVPVNLNNITSVTTPN